MFHRDLQIFAIVWNSKRGLTILPSSICTNSLRMNKAFCKGTNIRNPFSCRHRRMKNYVVLGNALLQHPPLFMRPARFVKKCAGETCASKCSDGHYALPIFPINFTEPPKPISPLFIFSKIIKFQNRFCLGN